MSRHVLQPLLPKMHREVVVGWDRPLETFFVQAIWTSGSVHRWRGARLREIPTARAAITIASSYAIIPSDLFHLLEQDALREDAPDGPAQILSKALLQ